MTAAAQLWSSVTPTDVDLEKGLACYLNKYNWNLNNKKD